MARRPLDHWDVGVGSTAVTVANSLERVIKAFVSSILDTRASHRWVGNAKVENDEPEEAWVASDVLGLVWMGHGVAP
ncbi:hypothetical protein THAOC_10209, partial [Thalassiosira oceanica]